MADHVRRQFRETVAIAVTGLVTTGARVVQSRRRLAANELPGLRVYVEGDAAANITIDTPPLVEREVELVVEGVAKLADGLENQLDAMSKEVEAALGSSVTVGTHIVSLEYAGCDVQTDEEGELSTGAIALRFKAKLFNYAGTPDVLV